MKIQCSNYVEEIDDGELETAEIIYGVEAINEVEDYWKINMQKLNEQEVKIMKIHTAEKSGTDLDAFEKPLIDEGFYEAKLVEVKDIAEGKYGARVGFLYQIEGKQDTLIHIVGIPMKATPDNKYGRVLMAHGIKLDGQEVDTDILIGSKVKVVVENYELKDEDGNVLRDKEGNKKRASIIAKVKPLVDVEKVN